MDVKTMLQRRLAALEVEFEALKTQIRRYEGAIEQCQWTIAELEKPQATPAEDDGREAVRVDPTSLHIAHPETQGPLDQIAQDEKPCSDAPASPPEPEEPPA